MKLLPANKFLILPSFSIYTYLFIRQLLFSSNNIHFKITNFILLNIVYLYEVFVAVFLKKSILYNWKLKDYIQHHLTLSLFMILYYKYGEPLDIYYNNMQKYIILINNNEITSILQNLKLSKKYIVILKFYCLYNLINLMYYEISESIKYYHNVHSNKKYFIILPLLAVLYHFFIVLPITLKYLKKNIMY